MFRGVRAIKCSIRSVYIAPHSASFNASRRFRGDAREDKQELAELDSQLKELKKKQKLLRERLLVSRDQELQQKLIELDGLIISKEASASEIAALEAQLATPQLQNQRTAANIQVCKSGIHGKLPQSIQNLLPASSQSNPIRLFAQRTTPDWVKITRSLPSIPSDVPVADVEQFIVAIPLKTRSLLVEKLEKIIPSESQSQFVQDQLMAAYAETGNLREVERLFKNCITPTIFSFSHLTKALFKTGSSPESLLAVLKEMSAKSIEPTLPIMSTVLQSYIQHGRHGEAETLFDNMKYWSVNMMPDLKIYNSMVLSAAKQHNVNRCLDLLTEMKERRPYPLQPNQETYNYLVYACARDPKTHIMAWDLFMEAQALGFSPDRQTFRALLYLCGSSGETLLARALVRTLSEKSPQFIDQYAINCLMSSYRHWQPGPSHILTSPSGKAIRANILMSGAVEDSSGSLGPPLLPVAQLNDQLILLESNAVFEFYADTSPHMLFLNSNPTRKGSPVFHNFLMIAINLGKDISEFKRRFYRFSSSVEEKESNLLPPEESVGAGEAGRTLGEDAGKDNMFRELPTGKHGNVSVPRDQHLYRLALQAAAKFKDLDFGREIWTERGQWRRSELFRSLPQSERNKLDFQFARDLVNLLAVCGHVEEAILLVKSAQNLQKWRKHHLTSLIETCEKLEDAATLNEISRITRKSTLPEV